MRWLRQERDRLHQSIRCRHAWPSPSRYRVHGCVQVGANGPEQTWFLSMLEWRSMTHTTVRCFWLKSYCMSCVRSVMSSLSSSKAMFLLTKRVRQSTFWNETPAFIYFARPLPANSTDMNQIYCKKIWEKCSSRSSKFMTSINWSSSWLMSGVSSKASSSTKWMSGANVYAHEFVWKEDLLSIYFNCNNAYVVLHMLFGNIMNNKQVLPC